MIWFGVLLIVLAIIWSVLKEIARGFASAPSMHRMSHTVSLIAAGIGVVLIIIGVVV